MRRLAGWFVARALDLVLGKAITHEPWPATDSRREHYSPGVDGLIELQAESNHIRTLRRIHAEHAVPVHPTLYERERYWCMFPGCGRTDFHVHE